MSGRARCSSRPVWFYDSLAQAAANYHNQFSGGSGDFTLSYKTVSTVVDPFAPIPELTQNLLDHLQSHSRAELETAQCLTGPHRGRFYRKPVRHRPESLRVPGADPDGGYQLELAQRELMAREWAKSRFCCWTMFCPSLTPGRQDFVLENRLRAGVHHLLRTGTVDQTGKNDSGRKRKHNSRLKSISRRRAYV